MEFDLSANVSKDEIFNQVSTYLGDCAINWSSKDDSRPWGGFFVIDEMHTTKFIEQYFPSYPREQLISYGTKLSPKLLIVEPNKRLSWQYHHRRAELWRVLNGPVGVITSNTDHQGKLKSLNNDQTIQFDALIRHRLVGLNTWGIVAEIWQHTDDNNPSDENDIVRLDDDYGR